MKSILTSLSGAEMCDTKEHEGDGGCGGFVALAAAEAADAAAAIRPAAVFLATAANLAARVSFLRALGGGGGGGGGGDEGLGVEQATGDSLSSVIVDR